MDLSALPADPAFYLAALVAVAIAGVAKGGFGGGAAFAATPILALASGPTAAAAILLPIFCLMDAAAMWRYHRRWSWPNGRALMLACAPGVALGWLTFGAVNPAILKIGMGALALGFLALRVIGTPRARAFSPTRAWLCGIGAGYTSFIAHAGGPLIAMALLPQNLDRTTFQATTVLFFWWVNLIKLPPYAALGLFSAENISASILFAPVAVAAVALGAWMHHWVSEYWFFVTINILLALVSIKLIIEGASDLILA